MSISAEDARFEVRRHLAARPTASLDLDSLVHGLRRKGLEITADEARAACVFLAGLDPVQVTITRTSLGSSERFQITSAGVLAYERND